MPSWHWACWRWDAVRRPRPMMFIKQKAHPASSNDDAEVDERIQRLVASEFPTLDDENAASFWPSGDVDKVKTSWPWTPNTVALWWSCLTMCLCTRSNNFLYKVYRRYFDPSEFTRVVPDFVVQGGNSEEERPQQLRFLIGQHTLPAEFKDHHIHTRGALAMSRSYSDKPRKTLVGIRFLHRDGPQDWRPRTRSHPEGERAQLHPRASGDLCPSGWGTPSGRRAHGVRPSGGGHGCRGPDWRQPQGTAAIGLWNDWKFG